MKYRESLTVGDRLVDRYKEYFDNLLHTQPEIFFELMREYKKSIESKVKEIPYRDCVIEYILNKKHECGGIKINKLNVELTIRESLVFQLYFVDQLDVETIAHLLECTESAIYNHIGRIKKKFNEKT